MNPPLKKQSIVPRIDGILRDIEKLKKIGSVSLQEFSSNEDTFALAQFHLRQALEGVFHISEHILSRLNGGRSTEYKEIARRLGEHKIVPVDFANQRLTKMAGYRNRLTHFYASVSKEEIYKIIHEDLDDFQIFIHAIKELLMNLDRFDLTLE